MKNNFAFVEKNCEGAFEVILVEDSIRFDTPCAVYCTRKDAEEEVKNINKQIERGF